MTTINTRADALSAYHVTAEQLSKVQAVQDGATGQWFYLAESSSKPGVEYKVVYNAEVKALQCLPFNDGPVCEASAAGIGCWHKRASLAAHAIYRLEQRQMRAQETQEVEAVRPVEESAEQSEIERLVAQGRDRAEATRVIYAKGTQYSERQIRAAQRRNEIAYKPFSLLK